jgi:hypothetical protein
MLCICVDRLLGRWAYRGSGSLARWVVAMASITRREVPHARLCMLMSIKERPPPLSSSSKLPGAHQKGHKLRETLLALAKVTHTTDKRERNYMLRCTFERFTDCPHIKALLCFQKYTKRPNNNLKCFARAVLNTPVPVVCDRQCSNTSESVTSPNQY